MRINKFIAQATGMSRRAADQVIAQGRVQVNGAAAATGQNVTDLTGAPGEHDAERRHLATFYLGSAGPAACAARNHSSRNAVMGSTAEARCAGANDASSAISIRTTGIIAKLMASKGVTPYNMDWR